eukprot:CAMPEP_0204905054 /NCGR_PEP_ID=MMETSP1397-20131031/5214_1 /ASSEMBLY_ACC=CAM_ASM_000891 /TAXON_ID=49980 /ORGANISM="Climacostomum Climacostomum virens, Strain Stock W-24" /LENGTH=187 /DNA_ID=CAMNT_0052073907 /DNA_START=31 /DNA_END=594 /DNA_ORIENTATION=+
MYSRVGILSARANSVAARASAEIKATKVPALLRKRERQGTPLTQRVERAVKEAEAMKDDSSKKILKPHKPELSSSFTVVSRERANSIKNAEFPSPAQYNPNYEYLMKNFPRIMISRPKNSSEAKQRCNSIENRLPRLTVSEIIGTSRNFGAYNSMTSFTHRDSERAMTSHTAEEQPILRGHLLQPKN